MATLALILAAGAIVVASYHLGAKSLWLDEATSASYARHGLGGLVHVVTRSDPNMGLYYVLLGGWVRLFGEGEVALRLPSVLCGGAAVGVTVLLGNRLLGPRGGAFAGLLLAVNPFFVHYEQTARSYSLVTLLVVASCYLFVSELDQPSRARRAAYVLASALGVYAHYFASLVWLAQIGCVLVIWRRGAGAGPATSRTAFARRWSITMLTVALLCLPEVGFAERAGTAAINWIPAPTLTTAGRMLGELAGGGSLGPALWLVGGCGLLCWATRRYRHAAFLGAWLLVPIALDLAVSFLGRPLTEPYYLIVVLPSLVLLAAAAISSLRVPGRDLILALLVLLSGVNLQSWYIQGGQEDYRAATRYLLAHERAGDLLVEDPGYIEVGFAYYERREGRRGPAVFLLPPSGAAPVSQVRAWPHASRVWFAFRTGNVTPARRRALQAAVAAQDGPARERASFADLELVLYQRPTVGARSQRSS